MMTLTHYGTREWLGAAVIALVLIAIAFSLYVTKVIPLSAALAISAFLLLCWGYVAFFFRDPVRTIPADKDAVISPADGIVRDIELIKNESADCEELKELFKGKDMVRIGIFLSVFNVHLNRAPFDMTAVFTHYREGFFRDARDARASKENEAMLLGAMAKSGDVNFPVAVRQISGAIARRIVCPVKAGDVFAKGDRYGMIKFGSRTELYLPAGMGFEVAVKIGDAVKGGETIMARMTEESGAKLKEAYGTESR